jgi:large subunit ribosomal protein L34
MTKRTFGGTKRKAIKIIGFKTRMSTTNGRKVLSNRRKKGRKLLTTLKKRK